MIPYRDLNSVNLIGRSNELHVEIEVGASRRLILFPQSIQLSTHSDSPLSKQKIDTMPSQQDEKRQAAREVIDILYEISMLLVCFP